MPTDGLEPSATSLKLGCCLRVCAGRVRHLPFGECCWAHIDLRLALYRLSYVGACFILFFFFLYMKDFIPL